MRKVLNITSTVEQGMSIKSITMFLGTEEQGVLKVATSEEGFSTLWEFTVYLDRKKIHWQSGHFWVKRFFNPTATKKILQLVNDYFDDLLF